MCLPLQKAAKASKQKSKQKKETASKKETAPTLAVEPSANEQRCKPLCPPLTHTHLTPIMLSPWLQFQLQLWTSTCQPMCQSNEDKVSQLRPHTPQPPLDAICDVSSPPLPPPKTIGGHAHPIIILGPLKDDMIENLVHDFPSNYARCIQRE